MRHILFFFLFAISANAQVYSVYFDTDKSTIKPHYYSALDSAVTLSGSESELMISCHCDSRADSTYNYHLSMRRAKAVQTYLLKKGVGARVEVVGYGEWHPDYPNTEELRYKNRRCDVKLAAGNIDGTTQNFTETDINRIAIGTLLKLDGLEFVGNQAVPNYYSMPVLYEVLKVMQENPELKILLKGHVCCGDDYPLSVARAKSVYDFLIANDVDASRMKFEGYSNTIPAVEEVDDATEQQNRRVEMLVLDKGIIVANAAEKVYNLRVKLREINFKNNTQYPDRTGEYNLNLLAEMIHGSNGYLYVLEVHAANGSLVSQRRNYIYGLMKRNGVSKKQLVVIPAKTTGKVSEDMLILEVKPLQ